MSRGGRTVARLALVLTTLLVSALRAQAAITLPAVPPGRVRIVVLADGFERHEQIELVRAGRAVTTVFLRPLEGNPYRTVVNQSAPATTAAEPVTGRALEREEIATMPGTQGDPLRAVQSLPGVGRSPGGVGFPTDLRFCWRLVDFLLGPAHASPTPAPKAVSPARKASSSRRRKTDMAGARKLVGAVNILSIILNLIHKKREYFKYSQLLKGENSCDAMF